MITQRLGGLSQVAAAGAFKVEADQVHDTVFGFFKVRAQELVAEVTCNLDHSFGRIGADGIQFLAVNDAVLHAKLQRFFKKRTRIVKGNRSG